VDEGRPNDYSSSLVKFDIVKTAVAKSMSGMCPQFSFAWLFGQNSRAYDEETQPTVLPNNNEEGESAQEEMPEPEPHFCEKNISEPEE